MIKNVKRGLQINEFENYEMIRHADTLINDALTAINQWEYESDQNDTAELGAIEEACSQLWDIAKYFAEKQIPCRVFEYREWARVFARYLDGVNGSEEAYEGALSELEYYTAIVHPELFFEDDDEEEDV